MTIITKQYVTETAHIVRNAVSERCKYNIHGHSYTFEVGIIGDINPKTGMVIDFKEFGPIKAYIDKFDHAMVLWASDFDYILDFFTNNFKRVIIMSKNCTAENMAKLIHRELKAMLVEKDIPAQVQTVKVWETATSCAIAIDSDDTDITEFMHDEN